MLWLPGSCQPRSMPHATLHPLPKTFSLNCPHRALCFDLYVALEHLRWKGKGLSNKSISICWVLRSLSLSQVHSKQTQKEVVLGLHDLISVHLPDSPFSNFLFSHSTLDTQIFSFSNTPSLLLSWDIYPCCFICLVHPSPLLPDHIQANLPWLLLHLLGFNLLNRLLLKRLSLNF